MPVVVARVVQFMSISVACTRMSLHSEGLLFPGLFISRLSGRAGAEIPITIGYVPSMNALCMFLAFCISFGPNKGSRHFMFDEL